tara:strand:+ start:438 stop:674 length:237 start_codon:yes stop_codon:yes gene_type:complete
MTKEEFMELQWAALFTGRRDDEERDEESTYYLLQWGRPFYRAERTTNERQQTNQKNVASMGPPFLSGGEYFVVGFQPS